MTVFVVSLFLPHTVHFNVGEPNGETRECVPDISVLNDESGVSTATDSYIDDLTIKIQNQSQDILSKSMRNLLILGSPLNPESPSIRQSFTNLHSLNQGNPSAENFFYNNLKKCPSTGNLLKSDIDIVQPSNLNFIVKKNASVSVIQPKSRAKPALVLPGITSQPTPNSILNLKTNGAMSSITSSLASSSSGMIPYSGFSNPNIERDILNHDNIFDTASWEIVKFLKGNGSLRNAIDYSIQKNQIKDDVAWVGTIGIPTDELPDKVKDDIKAKMLKDHKSVAVFTDDFTFQGHYKNFCKQILWPTLHYQVPDDPKSKAFEDHSWEYYKLLNEIFADEIAKKYKPGDVIWVHDYHLLLLPQLLRDRLGPEAKIGFFLHTAFPSLEVFRCLAQRKNLLLGMVGANAIGFQISEYCRHFLQTCNRILLADIVNDYGILYDGKYTDVYSSAIGIDAKRLAQTIQNEPSVDDWKKMIEEKWEGKRMIVNRDKLDTLRGIKQKLLAYEILLTQNPEMIENTVFIQICMKSNNKNSSLEAELMLIVERINSLSTDFTICQPVVFLNQDIDFLQYLALMARADTFIVSTMREGMNLTCHEFLVAAEEKKAPLILSEFTGSASILQNGALLINPWDLNLIAKQIHKALTMSDEEKLERWNKLYAILLFKNCYAWVCDCLQQIDAAFEKQKERRQTVSIKLDDSRFLKTFKDLEAQNSTKKRLFFFDFDSTLGGNGNANTSVLQSRITSSLTELTSNPANLVFVTSYNTRLTLERMYERVSNVGLLSENGSFVKFPDANSDWVSFITKRELKWKKTALKVLQSIEERLSGSYIEVEESLLRFHTEYVEDKARAAIAIGECVTHINESFRDENIHAYVVSNVVVIQQADIAIETIGTIIQLVENGEDWNEDIFDDEASTISTKLLFREGEHKLLKSMENIDLLIYTSDSNPITELIFDYLGNISKLNQIKHVFTVAAGYCHETSAMSQVDGMNRLLSIFESACK